jgi:two-component system phosphate regulon sensor histidine kinase PhoR
MKIQTKITSTYVAIILLVVVSLGVLTSIWIESFFKDRMVKELSRQAELVLYILQEDSTHSFAIIDEKVKKISGIEHLRITLIDEVGKVIAESDIPFDKIDTMQNHLDRPEIIKAKQYGIGHDIRFSTTVGHDFFYMAKEIRKPLVKSAFRQLHYIRLSAPYEDVKEQINHIRSIVTVAGFGVLMLIVAVSLMISKRITKSMRHIADRVEKIHSGDLDARLDISSKDEIGSVARAVNELVAKLKDDIVQLKKLERVRREFLGNVSHELRTPIFAIQGYLETLQAGAIDDRSVNRSFLEKAQTNLGRLNTLLEDLINISQIESGEMKMSFRFFQINEFLESVRREYGPVAERRNIRLLLSLGTGKEVTVFGDRDRLRQVLYNLLSNAINYNKENGEVVISSENRDGDVQITVKDTGIGIPQEHLPRIFERFYRVSKDRSRELGGTGLGLAIVKHIIEAHNTNVMVESKVGEGSSFGFILKGNKT